ncbi:hypothetical protein DL96DRAFT_1655470 [Flagelloscypha sp. PMI_526]|nr:hypothetical protein DL96DRAFT_1655470 [Flagelloscypha sp. PMI_526]
MTLFIHSTTLALGPLLSGRVLTRLLSKRRRIVASSPFPSPTEGFQPCWTFSRVPISRTQTCLLPTLSGRTSLASPIRGTLV